MGTWTTQQIAGRTAEVFDPATDIPPRGAVLFLHDLDLQTPGQVPLLRAELERCGLAVVSPHGGRCWWLDRVCSEFDPRITPLAWIRESLVPELSERWKVAPPCIAVCGIGMGGQAALQIAYRHPRLFPVAAALSPFVDFHDWHGRGTALDEMFSTAEGARQETATLHVHPLNWPPHQMFACDPADHDRFEGCERLASKLASTGIPFESDLQTTHGGDSGAYVSAMFPRVAEFLTARLQTVCGGR